LCGDAPVSNFGLFASPEKNLVFDINDFDETLPGPWEWDVKRLVASVAIVARENGFGHEQRERVVRTCARAYRDRMRTLATMRELDVWYARTVVDNAVEADVDPAYGQAIRRTAAKAHTRDNLQALSKLTRVVDGRRRLASDPPLLIPIEELVGEAQARRYEEQMSVLIDEYRQSLSPAGASSSAVSATSEGHGRWSASAASALERGCQLRDWKESASVESMGPQLLADYGRSCAHVLARAHARDGRSHRDRGLSRWRWRRRRCVHSVRRGLCRQNERDYEALRDAVASGRVDAKPDL
jgi:uncharacterized protein DUF2252